MYPDPELVDEVAVEMGISSAFVEKDWYSVQTLQAIASLENNDFRTIFSGGTSLSKAYGLIQRFSEDLDFRCLALRSDTGAQMKKARRAYREDVFRAVDTVDALHLDKKRVLVASHYVKFDLAYPRNHDTNPALRPGLQIEFSFTQPRLEPEFRRVQSLVAQFSGEGSEVEIPCLSPVETAADKLSALTWRVLKRDRTASNDDPAMIRHLHDLAALISVVRGKQDLFVDTASSSFEEDQHTKRRDTQAPLRESLQAAVGKLESDRAYREEYTRFVDAMSYAGDDQQLSFDAALEALFEVKSWFA